MGINRCMHLCLCMHAYRKQNGGSNRNIIYAGHQTFFFFPFVNIHAFVSVSVSSCAQAFQHRRLCASVCDIEHVYHINGDHHMYINSKGFTKVRDKAVSRV